MTPAPATSYDELPYESNPFAFTHPDRLATIAVLFGRKPPPVDRCRVLELGCASGGNLLPMAVELPESRLVGVDLSRRQIADGQTVLDALGLRNIELKPMGILEVDAALGEFDYVICHGVYSWVPPDVQEKILEICARQLAPCGIAYVSYNTYPGWYVRRMIRDILYYHASRFPDLRERVQQARTLLNFLAQSVSARENSVYPSLLRGAAEAFRQRSDFYLLHEYLEEVNEPFFFHQFVDRAAAKGLQYLADAMYVTVLPGTLAPAVEQTLQQLAPDPLHREQYLDFLANQAFRRALLCHPQAARSPAPQPEALAALQVASAVQPVSGGPALSSTAPDQFRAPDGRTLAVDEPLLKAALLQLGEVWPEAVPFEALRVAARSRLGPDPQREHRDVQTLGTGLLNAYLAQLVELHVVPPRCVRTVGARPVASPLARYQAATGTQVTNLRHESIQLNALERRLVLHLDGGRDRTALIDVLVDLVRQNVLGVAKDGLRLTDPQQVRSLLERSLDQQLAQLARRSLLLG